MAAPEHHRNLAKFLKEQFGEPAAVTVFRDNQGQRPIPVGEFGRGKNRFVSTIGVCDTALPLPEGNYEFAAIGELPWLPNAVTSSIYWLKERAVDQWPLVCEDVVRQNARSRYRHMLYVPSPRVFQVPSGPAIRWLLGAPIQDGEIGLDLEDASQKIRQLYPSWFFEEGE